MIVFLNIGTSIVQARRNLEASLDKLEDAKKSTKDDDIEVGLLASLFVPYILTIRVDHRNGNSLRIGNDRNC